MTTERHMRALYYLLRAFGRMRYTSPRTQIMCFEAAGRLRALIAIDKAGKA